MKSIRITMATLVVSAVIASCSAPLLMLGTSQKVKISLGRESDRASRVMLTQDLEGSALTIALTDPRGTVLDTASAVLSPDSGSATGSVTAEVTLTAPLYQNLVLEAAVTKSGTVVFTGRTSLRLNQSDPPAVLLPMVPTAANTAVIPLSPGLTSAPFAIPANGAQTLALDIHPLYKGQPVYTTWTAGIGTVNTIYGPDGKMVMDPTTYQGYAGFTPTKTGPYYLTLGNVEDASVILNAANFPLPPCGTHPTWSESGSSTEMQLPVLDLEVISLDSLQMPMAVGLF